MYGLKCHCKPFVTAPCTSKCLLSESQAIIEGEHRIAEVQYFARVVVQDGSDDLYGDPDPQQPQQYCFADIALVMLYSPPQPYIFQELYGVLVSSTKLGNSSLCAIKVTTICSVIGMVPHHINLLEGVGEDRYFLVEKMGLELACIGTENNEET